MDDQFIAAARREIERANKRADSYAGPCHECRWYRGGLSMRPTCANPVVEIAAFNVKPAHARYIVECEEQRSRSSLWGAVVCGPDGALFEPRHTFIEWLADLLAKFGATSKEQPHVQSER